MSLRDIEQQVIAAALRLVELRRTARSAALESCRASDATATGGVTRGEELAAERVLEASVDAYLASLRPRGGAA